ncbi:hypothetical protein F5B21DRAFT_483079 [Xylaria acuta]|nr:hypothetical protein F5B21DRAFT_483079 [Xylaria acuta]
MTKADPFEILRLCNLGCHFRDVIEIKEAFSLRDIRDRAAFYRVVGYRVRGIIMRYVGSDKGTMLINHDRKASFKR